MGQNKWSCNKKSTSRPEWDSLRGLKITINQIFLARLWYIGQIYAIPKYIKRIENINDFLWNGIRKKTFQAPRSAQLNPQKIGWILKLINPTNPLWKDLMYTDWTQLSILLKVYPFLDKTRFLGLKEHTYAKAKHLGFIIQLLNACLYFTNSNFLTPTSREDIFDIPIFLNPQANLDFSSDNLYLYCIPTGNTLS